jgi:hypothetical protein
MEDPDIEEKISFKIYKQWMALIAPNPWAKR